MVDKVKRLLRHAARLVVMAALVAFVVSRANFRDAVRPAPGAEALVVVRETAEAVVVRTEGGGEQTIPRAAFGPEGAVRVAGIRSIGARLARQWWWAAAAVAVMMLQSPVGAVRWKLLLGVQGIHITFVESLRLTYIGWFFNNWMPGGTGGDLVKSYYIAAQTHHKTEAVTVVFLDRLIGLVAMCMLGAAAVAASFGDPRVRVAQVLTGAFLAGIFGAAVVFYSRRMRRWMGAGRLLARLPLHAITTRVDRALFVYRDHKAAVGLALVYSWVAQAVSVLAMWWVAVGLGSRAAWHHYFVNMPIVWIGWSLVPVPGGFGVAETLVNRLFTPSVLGGAEAMTASEAATLALAMMLAYRLVQLVVTLPGGVLYLMRRTDVSPRHMRERLESEADADA